MKVLVLGDVFGKAGREAVAKFVPILKAQYSPDFIVVNAENATHGRAPCAEHCEELLVAGADVLTLGDHVFDNQADVEFYKSHAQIVSPCNIEKDGWSGNAKAFMAHNGKSIAVVSLIGKIFVETKRKKITSSFVAMNKILKKLVIGRDVSAILVDFHAEASSEKLCFAFEYDGKVSAVFGTHTHIPTADKRILEKGTGYITDIGMCGVANSAIGVEKKSGIDSMKYSFGHIAEKPFLHPDESGVGSVSGVIFDIDDRTGKTIGIEQILPLDYLK